MPIPNYERSSVFRIYWEITFDELSRYHKVGNVTGLRDLHRLGISSGAVAPFYLTRKLTPRMATSMCPPRIIANDSLESASLFQETQL